MSRDRSTIIHHVTWIDPSSSWHRQRISIHIREGRIHEIASDIRKDSDAIHINGESYYAGPGWCDIGVQTRLPSDETHETVATLSRQALRGGYTQLGLFSYREEPFDSRASVVDMSNHPDAGVKLSPIPAATAALAGERLTELLEMTQLGAMIATDGRHGSTNKDYHRLAMEYLAQTDAHYLYIPALYGGIGRGQVHESRVSAEMGLPGLPSEEETLAIQQMARWSEYTQCPLIHHLISSATAVDTLRNLRRHDQYATVSSMHLLHTAGEVSSFDEHLKVLPPLRDEEDRQALISALKDGVITAIVSNHTPLTFEHKARSFGFSPFGSATIDATFQIICKAIPDCTPEDIHQWLSASPRALLGCDAAPLAKDHIADIVVYRPDVMTPYQPWTGRLSKNSPYREGDMLRGHVKATVCGESLYLSD